MSDPKYAHIGRPAIKLIEECSELIKAVCKGDRFGWEKHHPDRDMSNLEELINEWEDVQMRYWELVQSIATNKDNPADD